MKPFAATADRRVCGVPASMKEWQEKLSLGWILHATAAS